MSECDAPARPMVLSMVSDATFPTFSDLQSLQSLVSEKSEKGKRCSAHMSKRVSE